MRSSLSREPKSPPGRRKQIHPNGAVEKGVASAGHYKVHVSCDEGGFELGEHLLSKQLIIVFRKLPDLAFAGRLEAMGFDHCDDERTFTIDATRANRQQACKLAEDYVGQSGGRRR